MIKTVVIKCKGSVVMTIPFTKMAEFFSFFQALGRTPLNKESYEPSTETYIVQLTKLFGTEWTPELARIVFSTDLATIKSYVDSLPEDEKDHTVELISAIADYMIAEDLLDWCNAYPNKMERFIDYVCMNKSFSEKINALASNPDLANQFLREIPREEVIKILQVPIKRICNFRKATCLQDILTGMTYKTPESPEMKDLRDQIAELESVHVSELRYCGDGKLINRLRRVQIEAPQWMTVEGLLFLKKYDNLVSKLRKLSEIERTKGQIKKVPSSITAVKSCCS